MTKMETLADWLNYIATLHTSRIDLGFQRIESIAIEQNLRYFPCPVVIVAGTNGKGSCVRTLERIYSEAGYRVGAYYSPHLLRFNERIRIQEREVNTEKLIAAFTQVDAFRRDRPLSFFEFTTLAALLLLHSVELDIVLLEVGLGGRLDAVNIVEPDISVVTSVGLDHLDWLGKDRESIAFEKAGIFRPNKPAICGDWDPPNSLVMHAKKIDATFFQINNEFSYAVHSNVWDWSGPKKTYRRLPIPNLKCQNAATSLMVVDCLQGRLNVNEGNIKKALETAKLPGRFEVFSKPVKGILDVAHNPDSARWLADQVGRLQLPEKKIAVIGMLKDKDIARTVDYLLPHIDIWFVAGLNTDRAADPQDILLHLKTSGVQNCYKFCTVSEAVQQAIHACTNPEDHVIVFGSFHTVAEAQIELSKEV